LKKEKLHPSRRLHISKHHQGYRGEAHGKCRQKVFGPEPPPNYPETLKETAKSAQGGVCIEKTPWKNFPPATCFKRESNRSEAAQRKSIIQKMWGGLRGVFHYQKGKLNFQKRKNEKRV